MKTTFPMTYAEYHYQSARKKKKYTLEAGRNDETFVYGEYDSIKDAKKAALDLIISGKTKAVDVQRNVKHDQWLVGTMTIDGFSAV